MKFEHAIITLKEEIAEFEYDLRLIETYTVDEKKEIDNQIYELKQAIEILKKAGEE